METRHDLVFEGKISDNCSPEDARRNLAKLLRREPNEIEALFSGKPFFLRRALAPETAYRFLGAMKHAGLVCRLVPTDEVVPVIGEQPKSATAPAPIAPAPPKAKLELAKPKLELAPADDPPPTPATPAPAPKPPAIFSECPKCRYRARGNQDSLISQGVCPACGLIIAKYLQLQAQRNRPKASADTTSAPSGPMQSNDLEFQELPNGLLKFMSLEFTLPPDIALPNHPQHAPTASLKRRFLAGVATWFSGGFLSVLLLSPCLILLLFTLKLFLGFANTPSETLGTLKQFETIEIALRWAVALMTFWLAFIYLPSKWDGLTYGQRLMRIAPILKNSDEIVPPNTTTLFKRFVGNAITLITFPLAIPFLLLDRTGRSIADRLSDCRQIEVGNISENPISKALAPLGYGLVTGLAAVTPIVLLLNGIVQTAQEKMRRPEIVRTFSQASSGPITSSDPITKEKLLENMNNMGARQSEKLWATQSPETILGQLANLEHQYFARHQRYSGAIDEIFMESPDRQSPRLFAMLMQQQQMRKLDIQLTANGFKIGLRRDDGWHIATEEGYQGVRPSF